MYFVNDQIEYTLNIKNKRMFLMTKISFAFIMIGFVILMVLVSFLPDGASFLNRTWSPTNSLYLFYGLFSLWSKFLRLGRFPDFLPRIRNNASNPDWSDHRNHDFVVHAEQQTVHFPKGYLQAPVQNPGSWEQKVHEIELRVGQRIPRFVDRVDQNVEGPNQEFKLITVLD